MTKDHKDIVDIGHSETAEEAQATVQDHISAIMARLVEDRDEFTGLVIIANRRDGLINIGAAVSHPMEALEMFGYASEEIMKIGIQEGALKVRDEPEEEAPHGCANAKPI